jgi:hypothetical protein
MLNKTKGSPGLNKGLIGSMDIQSNYGLNSIHCKNASSREPGTNPREDTHNFKDTEPFNVSEAESILVGIHNINFDREANQMDG